MNQPIVVIVPEGSILYQEWDNQWRADREGAVVAVRKSLSEAKQALVDLVKRENDPKAPFKRHKAYNRRYGQAPELVTVTSYPDEREAWVVNGEGRRSKVRLDDLRAFHPTNQARVAEMAKLYAAVDELQRTRNNIGESLEPYKKVG